jgi:hypothetical protein
VIGSGQGFKLFEAQVEYILVFRQHPGNGEPASGLQQCASHDR